MAIRQSTGLRNFIAQQGSYKKALEGGVLKIYTGSQPASADSAVAGTLLCTCTLASGARTDEIRSCGTVTLAGTGGSVTALVVDAIEILGATIAFTSDLTTTAALIAAQINSYQSVPKYEATSAAAVITIKAMPGTGTGPNGKDVTTTLTGMTVTDANMGAGGAAAAGVAGVNGLPLGQVVAGVLSKAAGVWSGTNAAGGTAGCFRLCGTEVDANGTSTTLLRLDGAIATSGSDLNVASTTLTLGATFTVDQFDVTIPAA